mmetsp:Transcript_84747/g.169275  ORF Transcript_84747/g.169275 Transcript_84747/m.169275 type:complete len:107 (+) Transcript_84747:191-511(+)
MQPQPAELVSAAASSPVAAGIDATLALAVNMGASAFKLEQVGADVDGATDGPTCGLLLRMLPLDRGPALCAAFCPWCMLALQPITLPPRFCFRDPDGDAARCTASS